MKELLREPDPARMGLLRSILESSDIATHVEHDNEYVVLQVTQPTKLDPVLCVVDDDDYTRAQEILRDHLDGQPSADEEVACATCGEPNPGNFEICWSCGGQVLKD